MADGSVVIDTKLDDSGVSKGINGLKTSLGKIGSVASTALKGVTVATGAVAAGFAGIVTASVQARGELEQQIGGTEAVFKDFAKNVQDTAKTAYSSMGLSANDYMATINKMGALMQGSGIDIETSMNLSGQAMQRAADIASIMGIDTASAMESIAGAAKGNFTMMDNLGVAMNATTIEAYAMSKGIKTSYAEMENSQKVQLAMEMFLEKTTYAMGNYTKENQTFAGSLSTMKASIQNFLSGTGDISSVIDSVLSFTEITLQSINEIVPQLLQSLISAVPQIMEAGNSILSSLLSGITENKDLIITSTIELLTLLLNTIIEFLPQLLEMGLEVLQSLVDGIQGNLPKIIESVIKIITLLVETIIEMLPQLLQMGITILLELIKGIAQALPDLIPQIIDCIILIVETLIDNIDLIIDAGIQLILGLADGLIEALPKLIEKIPVIIEKLINAIVNNLPKIIQMGITLIVKLAEGLIKAIPSLIKAIPKIITAIVDGLGQLVGMVFDIGKNIVTGIWNGISNMANWLWNKISGWCSSIFDNIKSFFGIHSPSRLFRDEIGENLGLGLGVGFEESLDGVYSDMKKAVDKQNAKLSSNLTNQHQITVTNEDNRQSTLSSIDNNREIQVNSTLNLDGKVIANTVNKVNTKQKLQYGLS